MSAPDPALAIVVANAVGALFTPTVALAVLSAVVTVGLVVAGLASERHDLAGLSAADRAPQQPPARVGIPLHARLGRSSV